MGRHDTTSLLLFVALIVFAGPVHAGAILDPQSLADARQGLDHLYHARTEQAAETFERIRERNPESPAPDFFLGGIHWQLLTTGPRGFAGGGPAEREFFARMDAAIERGEKAIEDDPGDLSARFFTGGAYGYKARYLALREKWWDAYRTGRRGVKQLEYVVKEDPDFADAYLGLGIYHYYTDVLPSVLKLVGKFAGLHGDRERGLREIHRALREGELVEAEARFFLAEIYTTFEEDQWRALEYSRSLRDQFPENDLYTWINARVLDELHLVELSTPEWELLFEPGQSRSLRGFLEYRLARSQLFGGDFSGAAARLRELLEMGRLGSRRISMWGRLRYGVALDFLGRHDEALKQYGLAHELDASDSARERASSRLAAGRRDPTVISLVELEETVRILKETQGHDEEVLRDVERRITGPSRGLSSSEVELYFDLLRDLAEARMRRGELESCLAAVDRALHLERRVPKESRAKLLALQARALHRAGRRDEAIAELRVARSKASWDWKKRIERDRELIGQEAPAVPEPPAEATGLPLTFAAKDRGEIRLEVEGDFLPPGVRLPMTLADGRWTATWPQPQRRPVRYRFVADDERRRIDPAAPRIELDGSGAWSWSAGPDPEN